MAAILWDTAASGGGFSLSSPRPTPADRFWEFVVDVVPVGPRHTTLGDGLQHLFAFRTDYTARFTIRHLAPSQLTDALALKLWLLEGGEVTVVTDDADGAEHDELTLRPGTEPEITSEDEIRQHFRFSVQLRGAAPITMDYSG